MNISKLYRNKYLEFWLNENNNIIIVHNCRVNT